MNIVVILIMKFKIFAMKFHKLEIDEKNPKIKYISEKKYFDEMGQIKDALTSVDGLLQSGGRCVCVTFHSIEDRIVKNTFNKWAGPIGDPRLPIVAEPKYKLLKTKTPSKQELDENPRARSAHMRGVEKV